MCKEESICQHVYHSKEIMNKNVSLLLSCSAHKWPKTVKYTNKFYNIPIDVNGITLLTPKRNSSFELS